MPAPMPDLRFERPRTVAAAAGLLAGGGFVPLAGGTDLYAAHVGRPIGDSLLDLSGTTHTNAGTYTADTWSFAGNGNYNSKNGTVNDKINGFA